MSDDPLEDAEIVAARENRRIWWRRAWVMVVAVLVAAPLTSYVIWTVRYWNLTSAQVKMVRDPNYRQLVAAHARYLQTEGPEHRGSNFEQLAAHLDRYRFPGSGPTRIIMEDELLSYLGPPDLALDASDGRAAEWIYFYDRFGSKDWALFVTLSGSPPNRTVSQFGWNASHANSYAEFRPYTTTAPSAAQRATSRNEP